MTNTERFALTLSLLAAAGGLTLNGQFFGGLPLHLLAMWLMTNWGRTARPAPASNRSEKGEGDA